MQGQCFTKALLCTLHPESCLFLPGVLLYSPYLAWPTSPALSGWSLSLEHLRPPEGPGISSALPSSQALQLDSPPCLWILTVDCRLQPSGPLMSYTTPHACTLPLVATFPQQETMPTSIPALAVHSCLSFGILRALVFLQGGVLDQTGGDRVCGPCMLAWTGVALPRLFLCELGTWRLCLGLCPHGWKLASWGSSEVLCLLPAPGVSQLSLHPLPTAPAD